MVKFVVLFDPSIDWTKESLLLLAFIQYLDKSNVYEILTSGRWRLPRPQSLAIAHLGHILVNYWGKRGGEGRDGKAFPFLYFSFPSPTARSPRLHRHVIPPLASKSALAWPWKSLWRRQQKQCFSWSVALMIPLRISSSVTKEKMHLTCCYFSLWMKMTR